MDAQAIDNFATAIAALIERHLDDICPCDGFHYNPLHLNAMIARLDDLLKGVHPHDLGDD